MDHDLRNQVLDRIHSVGRLALPLLTDVRRCAPFDFDWPRDLESRLLPNREAATRVICPWLAARAAACRAAAAAFSAGSSSSSRPMIFGFTGSSDSMACSSSSCPPASINAIALCSRSGDCSRIARARRCAQIYSPVIVPKTATQRRKVVTRCAAVRSIKNRDCIVPRRRGPPLTNIRPNGSFFLRPIRLCAHPKRGMRTAATLALQSRKRFKPPQLRAWEPLTRR